MINCFGEIHGLKNIAQHLMVHRSTLNRYIKRGYIKLKKDGSRVYAKAAQLDKWIIEAYLPRGKWIRSNRHRLNLTMDQLADKLNVSRDTIYVWEHDKHQPQFRNLWKLKKLFKQRK